MTDLIAGKPSAALIEYLSRRRSTAVKDMTGPGPDDEQIKTMIAAAARVPDHGKLFPWHFIVFRGDARAKMGTLLKDALQKKEPGAPAEKLALEEARFLRAPVVIAVISRIRPAKHPRWEQYLSAGAACQNLCLAANALGFGTNWLTEWCAFDKNVHQALGLDERDRIAGFVYIGNVGHMPEERPRPDTSQITTWWDGKSPLLRGDDYDKTEFKLPD